MLYLLAALMFLLSTVMTPRNSDLATIGGFIFLGLALHATRVTRR